jgi:hypothetical protein
MSKVFILDPFSFICVNATWVHLYPDEPSDLPRGHGEGKSIAWLRKIDVIRMSDACVGVMSENKFYIGNGGEDFESPRDHLSRPRGKATKSGFYKPSISRRLGFIKPLSTCQKASPLVDNDVHYEKQHDRVNEEKNQFARQHGGGSNDLCLSKQ